MSITTPSAISAEVVSIEPLTLDILRVFLRPQHYVPYLAGQYLQILMPEEAASYSIANAPLGVPHYELHLRHRPHQRSSEQLLKMLREQGEIPLFLPMGQCHVEKLTLTKPVIFLCQGTGFAPAKAMIEHWLAQGEVPPITLGWLTRTKADYYLEALARHWEQHVPGFRYFPYTSEASELAISAALLNEVAFNPSNVQIVLAGAFDRMRRFKEALVAQGIPSEHLWGDALERTPGAVKIWR